MHSFPSLEDTIVAVSTPLGQGGIGIVRLSGKETLSIADQMFVTKNKKRPSEFKSFSVHYGEVVCRGETIDEALLTLMRAPKSYTKEDVVEISSHGGMVAVGAILKAATGMGAWLAEPGEFTKRAFLNGRIDLTQAEAVLDIIQSKTEAFLKVSTHQIKGELSAALERIREQLMDVYTEMEALVNFPEEDTGRDTQRGISFQDRLEKIRQEIVQLLAGAEHGRILREGIKIVICGKPNVGKSSLLNVLLRQPRAIVSPIAGTTRDTIEETANIKGIPFQIVDTAGILEPRDLIEEEAVRRSHLSVKGADLVLFMLDASRELDREDERLWDIVRGQNAVIVLNKCDLPQQIDRKSVKRMFPREVVMPLSALTKDGIAQLEERLVERVWHGKAGDTHPPFVSNVRHINALRDCSSAVEEAQAVFRKGLSLEFASEEIKRAVHFLDTITGRNIDNDLLEHIFSRFCIGK